jgi:hypothetical protein
MSQIRIVGDCGLQIYQTEIKLKRATTVEFTTVTPICYIHLYISTLLLTIKLQ